MLNQKGIVNVLVLVLVIAALVGGVYLVQTKQIFKSRAGTDPITPVGPTGVITKDGDTWKSSSNTIEFELNSP